MKGKILTHFCILVVVAGIESLQPIFANSEPSVAVTSNTTVLAGAITENAAEFANADPVQPSDWDLDLRARADLQDRKLTADAAAATQTGAHRGENVNTDEIGLRVFTPPTEVQTRVAQGWSHIAPPTGAAAVAYGANAHAQEEDRGEAEEDMMDEEEAFQQLIDELGDMEPEVGRFGPDWEGDSDDE
ncbi:hypothetical protein QFC24_002975 [Naganishia onofrii]|uniref:Uncharacterized protein n=1 Tax=Naganishia onofrii TaxID=1851511 RepID=A0ACC2XNV5_9TREE|nr:hypothetical protein QFC24_002975 [Naganishia onofrii]